MSDKITMDVRFHVTKDQARALTAMFDYWSTLGSMGGSRRVGFVVDGDGNFRPRCQIQTSAPIRVDDEMREAAVVEDDYGHRLYDYDPVAALRLKRKREREERRKEQAEAEPRAESPISEGKADGG